MKNWRNNLAWWFLGAFALASVVVWSAVFHWERQTLTIAFLDVGQGDAIFIEAPNGNQMLIDGGPDKAVLRALADVMPFWDRSIDALVLTHPHTDHVAGLVDVLRRFDVDYAIESGASHTIAEYAAWEKEIEKENAKRIFARRGMRIWLSDGVYLDVLEPREVIGDGDPNETMVVLRLVYGDTSLLLAGDLTEKGEARLLRSGIFLDSDILKVPHHGSKYSSTNAFLRAVTPEAAIVSVGAKNRYGHPTKEALARLAASGAELFRTDTDGAVIFESDGEQWIRRP
ncbi:MAG: MBL fold metallo-hydrolase [Candidatus Niyogibacteria bacterium]|nr:MBL fold metallo-hydrolase [Candidatus Niyogibacteria bacterium]